LAQNDLRAQPTPRASLKADQSHSAVANMISMVNAALAFAGQHAVLNGVARATAPVMQQKSQSVPFLDRPAALDGTMVGDVGFDPLGISSGIPMAWLRESELKHGRVCMLATVGYIAVDMGIRAPYAETLSVTSLTAHDATVATGQMWLLLIACGVLEVAGAAGIAATLSGSDRKPGYFAFDPLGFGKDPKQMERMELSEIKNGRECC